MAELNCPSDEQLMAVATGGTVDAALQPHLRQCPSCQQRLSAMRNDFSALRGADIAMAGKDSLDASQETSRQNPQTVLLDAQQGGDGNASATVVGNAGARNDGGENGGGGGGPSDEPGGPAGDSFLPKRIGKYKVISPIGSGAQGVVVRALDEELSQDVVIKMSRRPLPRGESRWAGLADEGRLLAELKHHGLARVYYLGWHTERQGGERGIEVEYPYLVMEFVPGRNLAQFAADEHPSAAKSAEIVAKIARALGTAHHKGIVHQDIKPANILIEAATDDPRLIDFGLARFENAWSRIRPVGGTVAFMAPEQARLWLSGEAPSNSSIFGDSLTHPNDTALADSAKDGGIAKVSEGRITPRTDIYALGAVLYYLLTGRPPYSGSADMMLVSASNGEWDRQPLQQVKSPALRAIVSRAMALSPAERYSDADALAADLERSLARPRIVRRRWITAVAALLIAGLAILGAKVAQQIISWNRFQQATAWVTAAPTKEWLEVGPDVYIPISQLHITNAAGHPLLLRMTLQDIDSFSRQRPIYADAKFTPGSDDADIDSLHLLVPRKELLVAPGGSRFFHYNFDVLDEKTLRRVSSPLVNADWEVQAPPVARILSFKVLDEPDPTKSPFMQVEVTLHIDSANTYQFEIPVRAYTDGRLPRNSQEEQELIRYNENGQPTTQLTAVIKQLRLPLMLSANDDTRPVDPGIGTTNAATSDVRVTIRVRYHEIYEALGALKTMTGADIWLAARVNKQDGPWVSSEHDPKMWLKIHLPAIPAAQRVAESDDIPRQQGDQFQFGGDTTYPVSILPPPDPDYLPIPEDDMPKSTPMTPALRQQLSLIFAGSPSFWRSLCRPQH